MLRIVRNKDEKPTWIGDSDWHELKLKWDDPNYKSKCEKAKKNRASEKGGCINTTGSINAAEHLRRLEAHLGRPVTLPELHRHLHVREGTGEYFDDRSRNIQEHYSDWQTGYRETQQSSGSTEIDPAEESRAAYYAWQQSVGPSKSGRLVGAGGGMGPSAFQNSIIPNLSPSSSSDRSIGRSHVPTPSELNDVHLLTQKLSDAHREMDERQAKYEQELTQMREQQRLNEEQMREQ